jgi:hypothetical protein
MELFLCDTKYLEKGLYFSLCKDVALNSGVALEVFDDDSHFEAFDKGFSTHGTGSST